MTISDIFIIGGGINGCGIARDAVGRGYSVTLAEANDLGSATSSASSKLIHGGLRYLEHYEFRLVHEALKEREVILNIAPHISWPMRFVLPHHKGLRPAWLLRLGLFLYDNLGGRKILAGTKVLDLKKDVAGKPLKSMFKKGFEYSDGWVDDARLVVLNAVDAQSRGAQIHTRTRVISARYDGDHWIVETRSEGSENLQTHKARVLINAAGPFVDEVLGQAMGQNDPSNIRLVRGSHIVVPKLFDHDKAYILQNSDERIIFAIPYRDKYTLIGTTDADHQGTAGKVQIAPEETSYLCEQASEYFEAPITPEDVVWTYSGVRPLYDDGASEAKEATRDYVIETKSENNLINIFGGKLTTYRKLAESVLKDVQTLLPIKGESWTGKVALAGGDFHPLEFDNQVAKLSANYSFLDDENARRLMRLYGTKSYDIIGKAQSMADLGPQFGKYLTGSEIRYLIANEFAQNADDILWRRTKLGIDFPAKKRPELDAFIQDLL